jgi:hypothetical protein
MLKGKIGKNNPVPFIDFPLNRIQKIRNIQT